MAWAKKASNSSFLFQHTSACFGSRHTIHHFTIISSNTAAGKLGGSTAGRAAGTGDTGRAAGTGNAESRGKGAGTGDGREVISWEEWW